MSMNAAIEKYMAGVDRLKQVLRRAVAYMATNAFIRKCTALIDRLKQIYSALLWAAISTEINAFIGK